MTLVLVIQYETAGSTELEDFLREKGKVDPGIEFQLLVPVTSVQDLHGQNHEAERGREALAREVGSEAVARLRAAGVHARSALVADEPPLDLIENELNQHPGEYTEIVLSTPPPGVSRWLHFDLVHQAQRRFNLPITHVVAEVPPGDLPPLSLDEAKAEAIRRSGDGGVTPPV